MPEGETPKKPLERIFFISDPHIPYHDKKALELTLRALRRFRPTIVVSVGDFIDCFAVSRWSKNPAHAMTFADECAAANTTLNRIDKIAPAARRIYIAGNHEDRLQRYLQDKAPELLGLPPDKRTDIPNLLDLRRRGWEYVPYKDDIRVGKVFLTHDVGAAGRYNVFKCLDTYQSNVVTGHTHRLSYVVEGDATGARKVSAQFGWLGDVDQLDYMHRIKAKREWSLGFGYGYLNPRSGYVYLVPVPIVNYSAVVEGRLHE